MLFLMQPHFKPRAKRIMLAVQQAFARRNKYPCRSVYTYEPSKEPLIVWGAGRPETASIVQRHVAQGGRAMCIDCAYWGAGSFRIAFDGHHPASLPNVPARNRLGAKAQDIRDMYHPDGPVLLIGLGPKSRHMGEAWEEQAAARIRKALPLVRIVYRPKPNREYVQLPYETDSKTHIDALMVGASLVVCRHSNCGIDACFAGIPVIAETGAPALLYNNDIDAPLRPNAKLRRGFLEKIAWLNWSEQEIVSDVFFTWVTHNLCSDRSSTG